MRTLSPIMIGLAMLHGVTALAASSAEDAPALNEPEDRAQALVAADDLNAVLEPTAAGISGGPADESPILYRNEGYFGPANSDNSIEYDY